jgi:hypothetical protein
VVGVFVERAPAADCRADAAELAPVLPGLADPWLPGDDWWGFWDQAGPYLQRVFPGWRERCGESGQGTEG